MVEPLTPSVPRIPPEEVSVAFSAVDWAFELDSESPDCPPSDGSLPELACSEFDGEEPDWFEPIAPTEAELRFSGSISSGMKFGSKPRFSSSGLIKESPSSPRSEERRVGEERITQSV